MKKKHIRIQFTRRQLYALRRADYSHLNGIPLGGSITEKLLDVLSRYYATGKDPVRVNITLHPYEVTQLTKWAVSQATLVRASMKVVRPTPLFIALVKLGGHCMRGGRA